MFYYFLFVLLGACFGSFFANWLARLADGRFVWRGLSQCPHCQRLLRAAELIPVLSYFFLRGKCQSCGNKISFFYPLIESAFIAYFVVCAILFKENWNFDVMVRVLSGCFLLAIAFGDWWHGRIFDSLLLGLFMCAALVQIVSRDQHVLLERMLALVAAGAFFGGQWVLSRGRAIGEGDIKLGGVLGFLLVRQVVPAVVFAYVAGASVAVVLLIMKRKHWHSRLALGPFLSLASLVVYFYQYISGL